MGYVFCKQDVKHDLSDSPRVNDCFVHNSTYFQIWIDSPLEQGWAKLGSNVSGFKTFGQIGELIKGHIIPNTINNLELRIGGSTSNKYSFIMDARALFVPPVMPQQTVPEGECVECTSAEWSTGVDDLHYQWKINGTVEGNTSVPLFDWESHGINPGELIFSVRVYKIVTHGPQGGYGTYYSDWCSGEPVRLEVM